MHFKLRSYAYKRELAFGFFFLGLLMLYFWKLRYGWSYTGDEPFYLAVPDRLLMGDAPVAQEWNLSQTSGYLLIPLVALFRLLTGGTEGIILFTRSCYLLVHAAVTLFIYVRLRRRFGWGAVAAALMHFMFIPYHTMAFSYNTIPIEALTVSGLLLAFPGKRPWIGAYAAGLLFAAAVLCCPFLAVLYLLYAVCALLRKRLKRTPAPLREPMFAGGTFLRFTAACAILAVIIVGYVLIRTGVSAILKDLSWLVYEPNHDFNASAFSKALGYLKALLTGYSSLTAPDPVLTGAWIAEAVLVLIIAADRQRVLHRPVWLCAGLAITLVCLMDLRQDMSTQYHLIMLPMLFAAIPAFLLCREKDWGLFAGLFVPGVAFSMAMYLSSNNESFVIALALSVSNVAGILFVTRVIMELLEDYRGRTVGTTSAQLLAAACCLVLLFTRAQIIRNLTYWDEGTYNLTQTLTEGPAKGVITSEGKAQTYSDIMADVALLRQLPEGNVLFMDAGSVAYLALGYPYGTFSPWFESMHTEKLAAYYENHPEKIPQYICIPLDGTVDADRLQRSAEDAGYRAVRGSHYLIMIEAGIAEANPQLPTASAEGGTT